MPPRLAPLAVALVVVLAACSRGAERSARAAPASAAPSAAPASPARPLDALQLRADEAASRAGSFAWEARVAWTVSRPGVPPVHVAEHHRIRQLASGDFEATLEVDPGEGPGAVTGRSVVFADGLTYARGKWAPWRERPTDRGEGARRQRDDSFRLPGELAGLYGPALAAAPTGEATFHGRPARRYTLSLARGEAPAARPPPEGLPGGKYDADTARRVAFLEGRVPVAADGELLLDDRTGVPLSVALRGAFAERGDDQLRVEVDLTAGIASLGGGVAAVHPPKGALADERKPRGVARALEAAGLRRRGETRGAAEAGDEAEPDEE